MAWDLVDLVDDFRVSQPAAGGICVVVFDDVTPGYLWRVRTMNVSTSSTTDTTATVYVGDQLPQNKRSGSNNGNQDTADGWLLVPPTRYLQVVWAGCSAGAVAIAAIQYELLERLSPHTPRPLLGPGTL